MTDTVKVTYSIYSSLTAQCQGICLWYLRRRCGDFFFLSFHDDDVTRSQCMKGTTIKRNKAEPDKLLKKYFIL